MNTAAARTLMSEARQCAMAMVDNGPCIQRELPNVRMDDATRTATETLCAKLIDIGHDAAHELFELDGIRTALFAAGQGQWPN